MAYTYQEVNPTLVPNTVMQLKVDENGVETAYRITPIDGYILHDKGRNLVDIDPDTMEETERFGYTTGTATCGASYDFTPVQVTDENGEVHTAYGSREFFARPASEVPADQIFGGVGNDHEVM